MKFDGHLIKNGVKLCASSVARLHKHEFTPEKIMLPAKGYDLKLKGMELDDFRNMMEFFCKNRFCLVMKIVVCE